MRVREVERIGQRTQQADDPGDRERAVGANHLTERAPSDQLHHDVVVLVLLANVVDQDDVRVAQPGRDRRLLLEAGHEAIVSREMGRQQLDRPVLLQIAVAGSIDDAHPPAPERLLEVVRPDAAHARSIQRPYPSRTSAPRIIHVQYLGQDVVSTSDSRPSVRRQRPARGHRRDTRSVAPATVAPE